MLWFEELDGVGLVLRVCLYVVVRGVWVEEVMRWGISGGG